MSADRNLALALGLAAALLSAPRAVALPPLDVEFGYSDQVLTARNYDLVSEQDHLSGLTFSAAVRPLSDWPLWWLELDDIYAGSSDGLHQQGSAALTLHDLGLSILYRRPLIGALAAFGRIGPRLAVGDLALLDGGGNTLAGQWQVQPGVGAGAGLEFGLSPSDWNGTADHPRSFGLRLEIGYAWFPDFQFNALTVPPPPGHPNPSPIQSYGVALGPLAAAGLHLGLNAFLRF